MIIGYCRVSTAGQSLDRQLDQLTAVGCERVYQEKVSGARKDRPELNRMLDALREGDVVVITELSRLGRTVKGLIELVEKIHQAGADIKSLKENIDTTSPMGKMVFTVMAAVAEMERDLLRERTAEGLKAARARGRHGGRPAIDQEKLNLAMRMYDSKNCTIAEITKATGVSKATLYQYLSKRKKKMKKIIFLDFDGVLVTDRGQQSHLATNGTLRDEHGALFDPECVKCLKEIIDSTDAEIVVTSTWKMEMGLDGIRQMWSDRDLPGNVIGVTPDIDPIHRGDEIAAWLTSYGEDCCFAIIDDTPFTDFFRKEQQPHLFKVDERIGIDDETVRRVKAHFQSASKKKYFDLAESETVIIARKYARPIVISVADDDDYLSKAELLSLQKGMEDIKNGRTYKMQEGESLTDFLSTK